MDGRDPSGEDEYTIRELSRITGLSSERIRAWERRYGLLSPSRLPNGYRVYSNDDLRTLLEVKAAVDGGAPIGRVAGRLAGDVATARSAVAPGLPDAPREALRAAEEGDTDGARRILAAAVAGLTPLPAWSRVVAPLLEALGDRWVVGDVPIWLEHVLTRELRRLMEERLSAASSSGTSSGPRAALFCPEHEHHEMPLLAVAARLGDSGWRPVVLGPHLPVSAAWEYGRCHRPALFAVSVTHLPGKTAARRLAGELGDLATGFPVVVGGRGVERYSDVFARGGVEVAELDGLRRPETNRLQEAPSR